MARLPRLDLPGTQWLTLQDQITALEQWIRKDLARPDLLARLQR